MRIINGDKLTMTSLPSKGVHPLPTQGVPWKENVFYDRYWIGPGPFLWLPEHIYNKKLLVERLW